MRPKRILFLAHALTVGGAETFLVNLLNSLSRELISPLLFSLGSEEDPLRGRLRDDVVARFHPRRWRYDLSPSESIRDLIEHEGVDTVFSLMFFPFVFLRRALHGAHDAVRIIISLHGTRPRSVKEFFRMLLYARMLSGSEEIVTTSENQKRYLSRLYRIPLRQFSTIYNGVDGRYFSLRPSDFDRTAFRERLGIPGDAIVIVNVAGFREEKRHGIMVQSLARTGNDGMPPLYLMFVGGGSESIQERTRQLAHELRVADRVVFAGVQRDVRPYYWISDIFTLASTSETFSLAALEAMSAGLPVVLTDVGGANEMVEVGRNGYLVQPGSPDALASGWTTCVRHLSGLDKSEVRKSVETRFSWAECVQQYETLLLGHKDSREHEATYGAERSA